MSESFFLIFADRGESCTQWKLAGMFEQTFFSPTARSEDSRSASQVASKIRPSSVRKTRGYDE